MSNPNPNQQPVDVLTDHMYDGIMEYDNPTPGWWHLIFFGSIVFSLLYFPVYHFSPLVLTPQQTVEKQRRHEMQVKFGSLIDIPLDDNKMLMLMGDEEWLKTGEAIFAARCALCHGASGEGLVGPNMTDDHYKNVKALTDFVDVIANGAANGAMPPQKALLNTGQIEVVAAYVANMRGSNQPGRAAEGEVPAPWPTPSDAPSPE
jgi:cytochrome c oxidase cbb3-type subunit 3